MTRHLLGQVLSQYNKNCIYQLCKQQSADTVVITGQYQLSAKRLTIDHFQYKSILCCLEKQTYSYVTFNQFSQSPVFSAGIIPLMLLPVFAVRGDHSTPNLKWQSFV